MVDELGERDRECARSTLAPKPVRARGDPDAVSVRAIERTGGYGVWFHLDHLFVCGEFMHLCTARGEIMLLYYPDRVAGEFGYCLD